MANLPISGLPAATLPLAGTEDIAIVQAGVTRKAASSSLGAWTLLSEIDATGANTVDFDNLLTDDYSRYVVDIRGVTFDPFAILAGLACRFGEGATPTYLTDDYSYYTQAARASGGLVSTNFTTIGLNLFMTGGIFLSLLSTRESGWLVYLGRTPAGGAELTFSASVYQDSSDDYVYVDGGGSRVSGTPVTSIQFDAFSPMQSGTLSLYGVEGAT